MQNKIYTDQTGQFPVISSKGNKYIMVVFEADSNNIMAEPMKSIKASELTTVYAKIHKMLTSRGLKPKTPHLRQRMLTNYHKLHA